MQQLLLNILPSAPPTLDGFVRGSNGAAWQAVHDLSSGRALYLWGGAGSGRSHLLHAGVRAANAAHPPAARTARYLSAEDANRGLQALALDDAPPPVCVAVDDVEQLDEAGAAALFTLFNRWRDTAHTAQAFAVLCAGTRAPRSLALREDLRTRLAWDLVFRLNQLSDDERAQALQERARERGLALSDELVRWILTHTARDMGQLSALVDALDRYSLARHRAITLPLLKELLAGGAPEEPHEPTPRTGPV